MQFTIYTFARKYIYTLNQAIRVAKICFFDIFFFKKKINAEVT